MVPTTSSSLSFSSDSFSFFDRGIVKISRAIKFLCSYGGQILPRYPDGRLRYIGGVNRVITIDRSLSFSGLLVKLGELCGWGKVNLRCQLPTEDLDVLISITSDEDLANLIDEYDLASRKRRFPLMIRAFIYSIAAKPSKSATPRSRIIHRNKASSLHPAVSRCDHHCLPSYLTKECPSVVAPRCLINRGTGRI